MRPPAGAGRLSILSSFFTPALDLRRMRGTRVEALMN
jgi:hypothetical protein